MFLRIGVTIEIQIMMCGLFSETILFTPGKLLELYPDHADYAAKAKASSREAGFLLEPEEQAIVAEA